MQRHGMRLLSRGVRAATGSTAAVTGAALVAVTAVQRQVEMELPAAAAAGVGRQWRAFSGAPEVVGEEQHHDFESTTIADILRGKGSSNDGSWLFCKTDDTVYDAVKSMTSHNVGALLVMKADGAGAIAGIITERDYLRKIIVQGRSSKTTKVGDIMTDENKLITVTPDTKVLRAMELMTENRIRHIPVCENRKMKGMVSIGDVVGAVVKEHQAEVNRLSDYVKGSY